MELRRPGGWFAAALRRRLVDRTEPSPASDARFQRSWLAAQAAWEDHLRAAELTDTPGMVLLVTPPAVLAAYASWCRGLARDYRDLGEHEIAGWYGTLATITRDLQRHQRRRVLPDRSVLAPLERLAMGLTDRDLYAIGTGAMHDRDVLIAAYGPVVVRLILALAEPVRHEWRRRPPLWDAPSLTQPLPTLRLLRPRPRSLDRLLLEAAAGD